MPRSAPFEANTDRYEQWFEANADAYRAELDALGRLVADPGFGLEIGVGTGRFAAPLGLSVGLDPVDAMLDRARDRGMDVVKGVAEHLPFRRDQFDTALIVTTICFVDDIPRTLAEAKRVLAPTGALVLGYIDADSPVGQQYRKLQDENPFYREATFVSTDELVTALEAAGFGSFEFVQTVFRRPDAIDGPEPVEPGHGEGSFVGLKATR